MNSKNIRRYEDIVAFNTEFFRFMNTIGWDWNSWEKSLINNNKIVLSLEVNNETKETNEWIGIVSTMKIFTKKQNAITNDIIESTSKDIKRDIKTEMAENKTTMETKIDESKAEIKTKMLMIKTTIETKISEIDNKMGAMETKISEIDNKMGAMMDILKKMQKKSE